MATSPTSPTSPTSRRFTDNSIQSHANLVRRFSDSSAYVSQRRRDILEDIDNAKFSWFHVKVALVSGAGFFTDAYDIFAINIVSSMLGYIYGSTDASSPEISQRSLTAMQELGIKVATPVGILVGQLLFGWLADIMGRKRIYGLELIIMMVATFGQCLAGPGPSVSVIGVLIAWRAFMGVGIGGDYPLSAVISSEFSSVHLRGRIMTAVFANQGWGQLSATIISTIAVYAYRASLDTSHPDFLLRLDQLWRIIIGLGCVPAVFALYFRLTIPETPRYTMDIERNVQQASDDVDIFLATGSYTVNAEALTARRHVRPQAQEDFGQYFRRWENLKVLIGTSYSWFALDIAFYGLGLNSSVILSAIGFGTPTDASATNAVYESLKNICVGNLILSLAGFVPGYWMTFWLIDSWGRKPIQFYGFAVLAALLVTMGFAYDKLISTTRGTAVWVFLYCLANFFQNFGPNTTTFIVPGEAFPTRFRSTAHGISAASGKLGAVVAQVAFQWLKNIGGTNQFLDHILEIFGFFMLTGMLSTLLIPETRQETLENLARKRESDLSFCNSEVSHGLRLTSRYRGEQFRMVPIHLNTVVHTDVMSYDGHSVDQTSPLSEKKRGTLEAI